MHCGRLLLRCSDRTSHRDRVGGHPTQDHPLETGHASAPTCCSSRGSGVLAVTRSARRRKSMRRKTWRPASVEYGCELEQAFGRPGADAEVLESVDRLTSAVPRTEARWLALCARYCRAAAHASRQAVSTDSTPTTAPSGLCRLESRSVSVRPRRE